jgi:hypothetical protein
MMSISSHLQKVNSDPSFIAKVEARPWKNKDMPRRILAVRLQAMGDLVITLPYLQQLKRTLPSDSVLDLLTREEVETIPRSICLFDRIYSIAGGRSPKKQMFYAGLLLPQLMLRRYEVVIDLQNNIISKFVRKALFPNAWSSFDRFSHLPAGERNRIAIDSVGLGKCFADPDFKIKNEQEAIDLLIGSGWDGTSDLVILNCGGFCDTQLANGKLR